MSSKFEQRAEAYFAARTQLAANLQILGAVGERLVATPSGGAPAFSEPSPFAGVDPLEVVDRCLAVAERAREAMKAASVIFIPELRNGSGGHEAAVAAVRAVGETGPE
ncbi:MAG: hypothetical protein IPK72_21065 [Candidatus Eisenbacteria bacterium]|nr:hypothetical protein [Candidatus Eisenbacteria bacterium]